VLALARAHRLTAHDALYLELALRRSAALATLDARLREAARAEGVQLV
jgi:predicted nucleic acid-binding protein